MAFDASRKKAQGNLTSAGSIRGFRRAAYGLAFVLCCAADGFVLHTAWTGHRIAEGQFRRGYFESFAGQVGLALDHAVRPGMVPSFLLMNRDELAVPPGMIAVAPLASSTRYDLAGDATRSPYVVIGVEAPVTPAGRDLDLSPGEARLVGARTLSLQEGRLVLVAWDPTLPWREDAARLSALRAGCATHQAAETLTMSATEDRLEVRLGGCSLSEPLPSPSATPPLLAALAGPEWLTVVRRPGWIGERWVAWPALAGVIVKVAALWWGLGLASAAAASALLGYAAVRTPVAAMLTWPVALIIGIAAVTLRVAALVLRRLPRRTRVPAALAVLALAGSAVAISAARPTELAPIAFIPFHQGQASACAVVGYSTVKGEGLRRESGGIRSFLDTSCTRCRDNTAGLFAGGETLAWARDAYCNSPPSFGADGQVAFLGGVNDDFMTGVFSLPRLFVAGQQGAEPWRRNAPLAAAASLARIDTQTSALEGLMRCARSRSAQFLFLHDFLVTDIAGGREPDRAAMLARRRSVVEAAGGTFINLLDVFGAEAGISWFNDYVHLSLPAHERIADLACRESP